MKFFCLCYKGNSFKRHQQKLLVLPFIKVKSNSFKTLQQEFELLVLPFVTVKSKNSMENYPRKNQKLWCLYGG